MSKKKTINLAEVYPYSYSIPNYARKLTCYYNDQMSEYTNGKIVYDDKFIYQQRAIEMYGDLKKIIEGLQDLQARGCTKLANAYYNQPYEDAVSTSTVVEDYPVPRYNADGTTTKEGRDLQKVLEQAKKARQKAIEDDAERIAKQEAEALALLKARGYKVVADE